MARILATVLGLCLLGLGLAPPAQAAKRVAFVVGIDDYDNLPEQLQLKKAVNDARAMGETLAALGYDVQKADNITRLDFLRQWQLFLNRLEPGDEAAVYFAGHGVEIGGQNFLLPRDVPRVDTGEEEVLKASGLALSNLLDQVRERRPQVSLYVLDACRDNPFVDGKGRGIGGTRGLARVEPPSGTFIMFSAGAGETALDRLSDSDPDPNSVYTRTLLPRLKESGKITDIARDVRREVRELASRVAHVQTPAYYDEVVGDFCPAGCEAKVAAPEPVKAAPATPGAIVPSPAPAIGPKRAEAPAVSSDAVLAVQTAAAFTPLTVEKPIPPGHAPIHECDRLAADDDNPDSVAPGVDQFHIDKERATVACRDAVMAYPKERRFSFQLARVLFDDKNPDLARPRFEALSRDGYPIATTFLGFYYANGLGVPKDEQEALRLFRQSAEQGDGPGTLAVAMAYEFGNGVDKDEAEALRWYQKAAATGNITSIFRLGDHYAAGKLGIAKDDAQAAYWYRQGVDRGDVNSIYRLGLMYRDGRGVPKDGAEAERLFAKGDERKQPLAMVDIGQKLYGGDVFDKDEVEAVKWFTKAADLGDANGMFYLGLAHRYGTGVAEDDAEAARWYRKAADLGETTSMKSLGEMYATGEGVPQDAAEAARWRKAAQTALYPSGSPPPAADEKVVEATPDAPDAAPASRAIGGEALLREFGPLEHSIVTAVFSPDGRRLYALASGGYFMHLDPATGTIGAELGLVSDRPCCRLVVSPDGKLLASGSYSNMAILWDAETGDMVKSFKGHTEYVVSVDFSRDGKLLASASYDKTIKIWDIESGKLLRTLKGHQDKINAVAFSPDGTKLASGGWDHVVKLWDVARGSLLADFKGHDSMVNSVVFSPDGTRLISAGADGRARLWDFAAKKELKSFGANSGTLCCAAVSPDGAAIATGGFDNMVRLWDVASGALLRTFEQTDWIQSVVFSPDGSSLASTSNDKMVKVWDVRGVEAAAR